MAPRKKANQAKTILIVLGIVGGVLLLGCIGCAGLIAFALFRETPLPYEEGTDLAAERANFQTTLVQAGPAPQDYGVETPPPGVSEVLFPSGELQLKAWLLDDPGDGRRRPAVVYLHGGFAFGDPDWPDASPFVDAGYVLMMPMLRGENGNPGHFELLYGEVDDAVAAGEYVSQLTYVDPERVYLVGHSAGAMVAVLAAMVPSRYREVSALSGSLNHEDWLQSGWADVTPYNPANLQERRLRNSMAFAASLRCPLHLFVERSNPWIALENQRFHNRAVAAGKQCDLTRVSGDHQSMIKPAIAKTIELFKQ